MGGPLADGPLADVPLADVPLADVPLADVPPGARQEGPGPKKLDWYLFWTEKA